MTGKRFRLLVVDDEANVLAMVRLLLRGTNFDIIPAASGEEALTLAQAHDIDMVLLDIMMPDMSGVTVCGHLRANPQFRRTPIVMLTALDDYATRREATQAGATDLITKPVTRDELVAKLSGVLAEAYAGSPIPMVG